MPRLLICIITAKIGLYGTIKIEAKMKSIVVSPSLPAFAMLGCLLPVLNLPKAFQTFPMLVIVCLLHLSPTYESKLSKLSQNEEASTQSVEALWSRQESNLDLVFRKHLFYPLNYGTIDHLVVEAAKIATSY